LHGRKYRVRVNCSYSGWHDVNSGIPQGSVLGPLLFLIYINDLIDRCGLYSDIYVFADDAKFFLHIMEPQDSDLLQYALNELQNWSHKWLLNLNINKCQVMSFRRNVDKTSTWSALDHSNQVIPLTRPEKVKDLGSMV